VAAGILVVLGISYLLKPSSDIGGTVRASGRNALAMFTSGFLVNFVNPFVFVIWIGFALHAEQAHGLGMGTNLFLAGILTGIFSTDVMKAYFAPRLRRVMTPTGLRKLYIAIGVIMLLFSVRLFIHAAQHWPSA
jgi:threonine/homoserine/homoserine lactone efflux protein